MNIDETDTIDGNNISRQITIGFTHITVLIAVFMLIGLFQAAIIMISGKENAAITYLTSGAFLPLTFVFWVLFSIWYLKDGYVNPKANQIQATDNPWARKRFEDGSTCFIVYQKLGLTYKWEQRQGKQIEVEKEEPLDCELFTITVKHVALEMKLKVMYKVWLPRLSSFIQNIADNSAVVLGQLKIKLAQEVEIYASMFESTDQVRRYQNIILDYALGQVQEKYRQHGIDVVELNFARCDYSARTQEELNKVLVLNAVKEVSNGMTQSDAQAFSTVAAATEKGSIKINVNRHEANDAFLQAMKNMVPAGAILMGMQNNQGNR